MDVLLVSRPGVSLLRSLRESETAWDAIRFYGPQSISIGVYIPITTMAGAISLTSDLKFFIRKYTADHLFRLNLQIYCTPGLTKSRYLTRDRALSDDWPYRLEYWIEQSGKIFKYRKRSISTEEKEPDAQEFTRTGSIHQFNEQEGNNADNEKNYPSISGGYVLEVWCTKPEFDLVV